VTRGQLPQTAGSLGPNGGGAATAVPPLYKKCDGYNHTTQFRSASTYV